MRKAIFFDIDGTLLDRVHGIDKITPRVESALRNLQKAGHYIFIATGRPAAFIYPEILNFGFDGFVMSNGALVLVDGKIIFRSELDRKGVKKICEYAASERIEYMLESYPDVYFPRSFTTCEEFCRKIGVDYSKFIRSFDIEKISVSKIECVTARKDPENLDVIYKKMLATPGFTGWADPFHFKSMEIYSDKVSKATGILHVLDYLGIDVKNSCAFGDGYNDREMIKTVGTGFAMATGSDELKNSAAHVVPGVHEDGVAFGIEKFLL